jgi:hypothetical protein
MKSQLTGRFISMFKGFFYDLFTLLFRDLIPLFSFRIYLR